jgi:hypothetical protein
LGDASVRIFDKREFHVITLETCVAIPQKTDTLAVPDRCVIDLEKTTE